MSSKAHRSGHFARHRQPALLAAATLLLAVIGPWPAHSQEPTRSQEEASVDEVSVGELIAALGGPENDACQKASRELTTRGVGFGSLVCECLQGSLLSMIELSELGAPEVLPAFVTALDHPVIEVRAAAARTLGLLRDPRAIGPVTVALGDPAVSVRAATAEALARLGDEGSIPQLVDLASDPSRVVREASLQALDRLGAPVAGLILEALRGSDEALKEIIDGGYVRAAGPFAQTLADDEEDPDARAAAALGLARLQGEEAVRPLIVCMGYSVPRLRHSCAISLEDLGVPWSRLVADALDGDEDAMAKVAEVEDPRVLRPILDTLDDISPRVRIAAAQTLRVRADPVTFEPLMEAFWNGSSEERPTVTAALEAIDRERFLANLKDDLDDLRTENKIHTAAALGQLGETESISDLLVLLRNEDVVVRTSAAAALGALEDPRAIEPLIEALDDPDPGVREAVATALGAIGDKSAIPALVRAMGDRDAGVRETIARALGALEDPVGRRIFLALEGNDAAIMALASRHQARTIKPLIDAYRESHIQTRRSALRALAMIGPPVTTSLMNEALEETDLRIRLTALATLARVGDDTSIGPLLENVHDVRVGVRIAAAEALASIGGPEVDDVLLGTLQDREARMREIGAWYVGRNRDDRATARLTELLTDPVDGVRMASTWALGRLRAEESLPVLARRLRDRDVDVRLAAVWALSVIGGQEAIDALVGALDDTDPDVVAEARKALDAFGEPLGSLVLDCVAGSRETCAVLVATGDERAVEPLSSIARWGEAEARRSAVRALGGFGTPEAMKEVVRAAKSWNPVDALIAMGAIVRSDLSAGDKVGDLLGALAGPLGLLYLPILLVAVALIVRKLRQPTGY